jgi:hypothetical protein
MLATPHALRALGYFRELQSTNLSAFRTILLEVTENPSVFFAIKKTSFPKVEFEVQTKDVTFSSESDLVTELNNFIEALEQKEWQQAASTIAHGRRSPNLGLKHIGAFRSEEVKVSCDNIGGICQLTALFREGFDSGSYLMRLAGALGLTEKPTKASRYVPEPLQTKLLCDSMHRCNVCREAGVIIHHIVRIEEGGRSEEENLMVLCLNHHNDAHSTSVLSKRLRPEHLLEYKRRHLLWVARRGSGETPIEAARD